MPPQHPGLGCCCGCCETDRPMLTGRGWWGGVAATYLYAQATTPQERERSVRRPALTFHSRRAIFGSPRLCAAAAAPLFPSRRGTTEALCVCEWGGRG